MRPSQEIAQAVDACYEAIFDPVRWGDSLHGLARSLDAACMMFYPRNPDIGQNDPRRPGQAMVETPHSRDYRDLLVEYERDKWYLGHYRAVRGIPLLDSGQRVVTEHDCANDEERRKLRHYN